MGLAELPVITLSGLSETQKRTLRIADNKIALSAGWDLEILQLELYRSGELHCLDKCAACRQILVGQMAKAWGELSARDGRWLDRAFVANDAAIHPLHERYMRGMRLAIESVPAPARSQAPKHVRA